MADTIQDALDAAHRREEGRRLRVSSARAAYAHVLRVAREQLGPDLGLGREPLRVSSALTTFIHRELAAASTALAFARGQHDDSLHELTSLRASLRAHAQQAGGDDS